MLFRRCRHQPPRRETVITAITAYCPDLTVRHGAFAGMRYPEPRCIGGPLFPRLLGSYERELSPLIEEACRQPYADIINVGCGEGYYAVGFARRMPDVRVHAYDIDIEALKLCRRMAMLNGVADRVITGTYCDADTLMAIPLRGRTLVMADCEGYERGLFSDALVHHLRTHDVLVEVHDFVDASISGRLRAVFAESHVLTCVTSISDARKPKTYVYPELAAYDRATRELLLAETRPAEMQWFMLRARAG